MSIASFHSELLLVPPSETALRYYASGAHGFSNDQPDSEKFLATFIHGLQMTWDKDQKVHRVVTLAVPKSLEGWVVEEINKVLVLIRDSWKVAKKDTRTKVMKHTANSVRHLEMGSRVLAIPTEPTRWVAFGFSKGSVIPGWLDKGLM